MDKTPSAEDSVQIGMVYKAVDGNEEVTPYFLDSASATVNYTPVGRSSEGRMDSPEFLKRYKVLGELSSMAEKPRDAKNNPEGDTPKSAIAEAKK